MRCRPLKTQVEEDQDDPPLTITPSTVETSGNRLLRGPGRWPIYCVRMQRRTSQVAVQPMPSASGFFALALMISPVLRDSIVGSLTLPLLPDSSTDKFDSSTCDGGRRDGLLSCGLSSSLPSATIRAPRHLRAGHPKGSPLESYRAAQQGLGASPSLGRRPLASVLHA